jgi:hypothetical protein
MNNSFDCQQRPTLSVVAYDRDHKDAHGSNYYGQQTRSVPYLSYHLTYRASQSLMRYNNNNELIEVSIQHWKRSVMMFI